MPQQQQDDTTLGSCSIHNAGSHLSTTTTAAIDKYRVSKKTQHLQRGRRRHHHHPRRKRPPLSQNPLLIKRPLPISSSQQQQQPHVTLESLLSSSNPIVSFSKNTMQYLKLQMEIQRDMKLEEVVSHHPTRQVIGNDSNRQQQKQEENDDIAMMTSEESNQQSTTPSQSTKLRHDYLELYLIVQQLRIMIEEILLHQSQQGDDDDDAMVDEQEQQEPLPNQTKHLSFSFSQFHFLLYHLISFRLSEPFWTEFWWCRHSRLVSPNNLDYINGNNETKYSPRAAVSTTTPSSTPVHPNEMESSSPEKEKQIALQALNALEEGLNLIEQLSDKAKVPSASSHHKKREYSSKPPQNSSTSTSNQPTPLSKQQTTIQQHQLRRHYRLHDETLCSPNYIEPILFFRNEIARILNQELRHFDALQESLPTTSAVDASFALLHRLDHFLNWQNVFLNQKLWKLNEMCLYLNQNFTPNDVPIRSPLSLQKTSPSASKGTPEVGDKIFKLGLILFRDIILLGVSKENAILPKQFHAYNKHELQNDMFASLLNHVHQRIQQERFTVDQSNAAGIQANKLFDANATELSPRIKELCQHLIEIGKYTHLEERLYEHLFENRFLSELESYFSNQSERLNSAASTGQLSIQEETIMIAKLMRNEYERFHLPSTSQRQIPTAKKIIQLFASNFAQREQLQRLLTGIDLWIPPSSGESLTSHNLHLLSQLHYIFQFVPQNVQTQLEETFFARVKQEIEALLPPTLQAGSGNAQVHSSKIILQLSQVYDYFTQIVSDAFDSETILLRARDQAFVAVMNASKESSRYFAESLAKYSLSVMRLKEQDEIADNASQPTLHTIESSLNRIIVFFKFLDNADYFLTLYRIHLAKRLILKTFIADREQLFIQKLREHLSSNSSQLVKLKRMFEDVYASNHFTETVQKARLETSKKETDSSLSASILTFSAWPYLDSQPLYTPHPVIANYHKELEGYYLKQYVGRKLSWIHKLEKGTLKCNGFAKAYEMVVNSFQASILLSFNSHKQIGLRALFDSLSLSEEDFMANFSSLVKTRLLVPARVDGAVQGEPPTEETQNPKEPSLALHAEQLYCVNADFRSRHLKISLYLHSSLKRLSRTEIQKAQQQVDMDREYTIQAIIVRIMKAEKRLDTQNLVAKVIQEMQNRFFKPDVTLIKKNISGLAEREYIRYVSELDGSWQGYEYIA